MDNIISVLNDVVFLDIEVSGLDCLNSEILEVGAVKVKDWKIYTYESLIKNKFEVPVELFSVCKNLDKNDLEIANEIGLSNYENIDKGNLTARENGYVGGYMTKKLVEMAERQMAGK